MQAWPDQAEYMLVRVDCVDTMDSSLSVDKPFHARNLICDLFTVGEFVLVCVFFGVCLWSPCGVCKRFSRLMPQGVDSQILLGNERVDEVEMPQVLHQHPVRVAGEVQDRQSLRKQGQFSSGSSSSCGEERKRPRDPEAGIRYLREQHEQLKRHMCGKEARSSVRTCRRRKRA